MDSRSLSCASAISFLSRSLSTSFVLIGAVSSISFLGCSQGSDIQIQGPVIPTAPAGPSTDPLNPSAPKGPGTPSTPGGSGTDSGAVPPRSTETTYRIFCDDRYPPFITSISSLATSGGFGAGLNFGELDSKGKFNPAVDRNLENQLFPVPVKLPGFGQVRMLFSANRMPDGLTRLGQPRFIFLGSGDVVDRGGTAKKVASEIMVSSAVQIAAQQETLSVRSFGVSDQGRYLLIGQADGYRVVDSTSFKSLGVVATGSAASNVNPELRESDMIFSVASVSGSSFNSKLYSLGVSKGMLQTSRLVSTTSGLRRPLVSIGPRAGESFAALDTAKRIRVVSPLKSTAANVKVTGLPAKGRLSSAVAVWRDAVTRGLRASIIFEHFVETGSMAGRRSYKIEQVFVRVLEVNESTLVASMIDELEYPPEAAQAVAGGFGGRVVAGASEYRVAPDGKAVFALFPGDTAKHVYRLTSGALDRVSQTSCTNMSIGVEL